MLNYFKVNFLVFVILFTTPSLGGAELMKQDVLAQSKIKKSSFKKVFNEIKKILSKEFKKCSIIVTDIKLIRADDELNVAEEWTVDICREKKVYFVSSSTWPEGYWINNVITREERFAWEKQLLKKTIFWIDDKDYTKDFYYFNEILKEDEFRGK